PALGGTRTQHSSSGGSTWLPSVSRSYLWALSRDGPPNQCPLATARLPVEHTIATGNFANQLVRPVTPRHLRRDQDFPHAAGRRYFHPVPLTTIAFPPPIKCHNAMLTHGTYRPDTPRGRDESKSVAVHRAVMTGRAAKSRCSGRPPENRPGVPCG